MSDYNGARLIVDALPPAKRLLADRGYDADWFQEALQDKGIEPCIPPRKNRKRKIEYDTALYKQRHKVENMLENSRTGGASQPAMTAAPILSFLQSALPLPSYSISINES